MNDVVMMMIMITIQMEEEILQIQDIVEEVMNEVKDLEEQVELEEIN